MHFRIRQPKGKGTDIYGEVWIDPVLRKKRHSDLRKAILKHETNEIRDWGKGGKVSHTKARKREPRLTRNIGGVSGFWKEIERRERNG